MILQNVIITISTKLDVKTTAITPVRKQLSHHHLALNHRCRAKKYDIHALINQIIMNPSEHYENKRTRLAKYW